MALGVLLWHNVEGFGQHTTKGESGWMSAKKTAKYIGIGSLTRLENCSLFTVIKIREVMTVFLHSLWE